jgi:iron complex transport system substrate-binding protein
MGTRARFLTVVLGLAGVLAIGACHRTDPSDPSGRSDRSRAAVAERIVALAPSLAETLFALGLGDRVVGVGDYSVWPPEVAGIPKLGGLLDPSFEEIVALKPDLALILPSQRDLGVKLERLGIATLIVPSDSLTDVEKSFSLIAERCGAPEAGAKLTAEWRREMAPHPLPGAPKVLLVVGRSPGSLNELLIAGKGTFLDDLLVRLGGVNAFADAPMAWPQINLEEVLARAPEAIVELRTEEPAPEVVALLRRDWQSLPGLPAVANGRIVSIGGAYTLIPGPRLTLLYRQMREALE